MGILETIDNHENLKIEELSNHTVLQRLSKLTDEEFRNILLERRHLAFQFTPLYDTAETMLYFLEQKTPEEKQASQFLQARKHVRQLIQEEYPLRQPSHRVDYMDSLITIGCDAEGIFSPASANTKGVIDELFELVGYQDSLDFVSNALCSLTVLRVAEEALVSTEYAFILPDLVKRFGGTEKDYKFFFEHHYHDQKTGPLGQRSRSHSDKLGKSIVELVGDNTDYGSIVMKAMDDSVRVKSQFWDQFRPMLH